MKIKKTLILSIAINTFLLLCLIFISRSSSGETAIASLNLPSISSQSTGARADSMQTASPSDSNLSNAVISAVLSRSTNTSDITVGPNPNPINTTLRIDIRIDNAVGFWGWTIPTISWNATVLQLTGVTEGPFLADNTGGDPTFFIGNSNALWNNTSGNIMGGLSEAITGADTSTDSSGVLATLTFNVTGYGNSPVAIAGGNLRATSSDTIGVNVLCNSAAVAVANTSSTAEFPSWIILPLFITTTLVSVVYLRKTNRFNTCRNSGQKRIKCSQ